MKTFLDRFGLSRDPAAPLDDVSPDSGRRFLLARIAIFLLLVALTVLAFPRQKSWTFEANLGERWTDETLTAPFDYAIFKSPETLAAERREARNTRPQLFRPREDADASMAEARDTLVNQLTNVFSHYRGYLVAREQGDRQTALRDSAAFERTRARTQLGLAGRQWEVLMEAAENDPSLSLVRELIGAAYQESRSLSAFGVVDVPIDSIKTEIIYVRDRERGQDRPRSVGDLYGLDEAWETAGGRLDFRYMSDPELASIATAFFRRIFSSTLEFMRAETFNQWLVAEQRIQPTLGSVEEGDVIVVRGQLVTEDVARKLESLARARTNLGGAGLVWQTALGQALIAVAVLFLFYLYLYLLRRAIFDNLRQFVLVALIVGATIALYGLSTRLDVADTYVVPVALASVLLTILFDSRVGIFATISLALLGGHMLSDDLEFTFATLFACTLAVFSVRDIRNRGQIFLTAGLLILAYAVALLAARAGLSADLSKLGTDLIFVAVNGALLLFTYPLLWLCERAFGITTDLTLLELSDTNRPVLRELSQTAPGTFNHVMQVANLAETCADAIGANTLLTRVGALYHDLGKMRAPLYFIENQRDGHNPHDDIGPVQSARIIVKHVPDGLEIGRTARLPAAVLRFVASHHGTTRIEYFYRQACAMREDTDLPVDEGLYRYPGPRPRSREEAILMLADSTEAASRSLNDVNEKTLTKLIDKLVGDRVRDGQLDDCSLTFRDLKTIRETLLTSLLAINHGRVAYPDDEKPDAADDATPKPDERNPHDGISAAIATTDADLDEDGDGVVGDPTKRAEARADDAAAPILDKKPPRDIDPGS